MGKKHLSSLRFNPSDQPLLQEQTRHPRHHLKQKCSPFQPKIVSFACMWTSFFCKQKWWYTWSIHGIPWGMITDFSTAVSRFKDPFTLPSQNWFPVITPGIPLLESFFAFCQCWRFVLGTEQVWRSQVSDIHLDLELSAKKYLQFPMAPYFFCA